VFLRNVGTSFYCTAQKYIKRDHRSHFPAVLLTIANLHTILHAQLLCAVCMNVYRSDRGVERSA
jgi:hypothetical protein